MQISVSQESCIILHNEGKKVIDCCPHWIEGPKLLVMFCDACNCDAESTGHVKDVAGSTDGQKGGPALQGRFGCILEGLAGCVGHRGNGMQVPFPLFISLAITLVPYLVIIMI